ncbi:hypothetical protein KY308_02690 [Candidatus Woesearchaeota archaeon]|nr:hypothetical protein [Candidatus Woesearchaeota archaeon]
MFYDRCHQGSKRLLKNCSTLREISDNGLNFIPVNRPRSFPREINVEEELMKDPFPYKALVINGAASESGKVVEDALTALEMHGLPASSMLYLAQGQAPKELAEKGVICIPVNGGNGHLTPKDAQYLCSVLDKVIREV